MGISNNLKEINSKIENAAIKSGRCFNDIKLIAVTKNVGADEINQAIQLGVDCIGENRIQEVEKKIGAIMNVEKHMIGHLQTNKVKVAVKLFDCIQSVDSLKLGAEINKRTDKIMPIFIEVNSGEKSKGGVNKDEVLCFYDKLKKCERLKVEGLMTIAPINNPEPWFVEMKKIFDCLDLKWLSMGMTSDYEQAIVSGSNMVRIGSGIFR